jgi:hypothetical protein
MADHGQQRLRRIRATGAFRAPQFVDLGSEHVPFDTMTARTSVEAPMLEAVEAGTSAAVTGIPGAGKSSVLAWLCGQLPETHLPIRVPVVGVEDPSDASVFTSVVLVSALHAAQEHQIDLADHQRAVIEDGRADESVTRRTGRRRSGRLGGGPIPAELALELAALDTEHRTTRQPIDRLHVLERLLGIFESHARTPVFVVEDTEAALGAGVSDTTRDRFFSTSLGLLVREIEAPTLLAVQAQYRAVDAYRRLSTSLLEVAIPLLPAPVVDQLSMILARRLEYHAIDAVLDDVIDADAMSLLAEWYGERDGSLRHVLAALEIAVAAALDSGTERLGVRHVRLGIEEWRDR